MAAAFLLAVVAANMASLNLVAGASAAGLLGVGAALLCGHLYRPGLASWLDRLVASMECLALAILIGLTGGIASYAAAASSEGFVDARLAAVDAAMGLDWMRYWEWAHAHDWVMRAFRISYDSIFIYPSLLLIALCCSGRERDAYRLLLALAATLALTVLIFAFFPARSAAPFYFGAAEPGQEMRITGDIIAALQSGALVRVRLDELGGYVTFPSFHAACAILLAWAGLHMPWLRWPGLLLNALMFLSTPIVGSHYFIDLVAGALVAAVGILAAEAAPSLLARFRAQRARHAVGAGVI